MPSFDALLDHLAARGPAAAAAASAATRATSRIITSERLDRYTPYSMHSFSSARDEPVTAPVAQPTDAPDYAAGHKTGLAEGFRRGFEAGAAHARAEHAEHERQGAAQLADRIASLTEDFRRRLEAIER